MWRVSMVSVCMLLLGGGRILEVLWLTSYLILRLSTLFSYCSDFYFIMSYSFYVMPSIMLHVSLRSCLLFSTLSRGSIGNRLSTSSEVVVWTAYILPSPDPTRWEYTGFVVVDFGLISFALISPFSDVETNQLNSVGNIISWTQG